MEHSLSMSFLTETGAKSSFNISGVKENLTQEEAIDLMDTIIENNVFVTKNGAYVKKSDAKLVAKTVTDFTVA